MMADEATLDLDVVDTTKVLSSTAASTVARTRGRRRKRSNTIDVGALLEFRSTVRENTDTPLNLYNTVCPEYN